MAKSTKERIEADRELVDEQRSKLRELTAECKSAADMEHLTQAASNLGYFQENINAREVELTKAGA